MRQLSDGAEIEITDKSGTTKATVRNVAGELVPSVSKYQSGTATGTIKAANTWISIYVKLPEPFEDDDYIVVADSNAVNQGANYVLVSDAFNKLKTGFYLVVYGRDVGTVNLKWRAFKLMTDAALLSDEAKIDKNASDIAGLKANSDYTLPTSACNTNEVTTTNGSVRIQSLGKLRICTGGGFTFKTTGAKNNITLLTLPQGYRPKYSTEGFAMCTGQKAGVMRCWVETSGIVRVWTNQEDASGYVFLNIMYIAAD